MNAAPALIFGGIAAVVAGAVLAVGAATATAEPTASLEVSVDGVAFATAVPDSILDETYALVPGDRLHGRMWVRNAGSAPGWIRVTAAGPAAGDAVYLGLLTLVVGDGEGRRMVDVDGCTELVPVRRLAPGQVFAVPVAAVFSDVTGTTAQAAVAAVTLRVTMADSAHAFTGACGLLSESSVQDGGHAVESAPAEATVRATHAPLGFILMAAAALIGIVLRLDSEWRARRRQKES